MRCYTAHLHGIRDLVQTEQGDVSTTLHLVFRLRQVSHAVRCCRRPEALGPIVNRDARIDEMHADREFKQEVRNGVDARAEGIADVLIPLFRIRARGDPPADLGSGRGRGHSARVCLALPTIGRSDGILCLTLPHQVRILCIAWAVKTPTLYAPSHAPSMLPTYATRTGICDTQVSNVPLLMTTFQTSQKHIRDASALAAIPFSLGNKF